MGNKYPIAYACSEAAAEKLEKFRTKMGIAYKTDLMEYLADHIDDFEYGRTRRMQERLLGFEIPIEPVERKVNTENILSEEEVANISERFLEKMEEKFSEFSTRADEKIEAAISKYEGQVFVPVTPQLGPKNAFEAMKFSPPFARWSFSEFFDLPLVKRRQIAEYDPYGFCLDNIDSTMFPMLAYPCSDTFRSIVDGYIEDGTLEKIGALFDERRRFPERHPDRGEFNDKIQELIEEHNREGYEAFKKEEARTMPLVKARKWYIENRDTIYEKTYREKTQLTKPFCYLVDAAYRGLEYADLNEDYAKNEDYWKKIKALELDLLERTDGMRAEELNEHRGFSEQVLAVAASGERNYESVFYES